MAEPKLDDAEIDAGLEQMGGVGWKGGAVRAYARRSPPSPLQTGRAVGWAASELP